MDAVAAAFCILWSWLRNRFVGRANRPNGRKELAIIRSIWQECWGACAVECNVSRRGEFWAAFTLKLDKMVAENCSVLRLSPATKPAGKAGKMANGEGLYEVAA